MPPTLFGTQMPRDSCGSGGSASDVVGPSGRRATASRRRRRRSGGRDALVGPHPTGMADAVAAFTVSLPFDRLPKTTWPARVPTSRASARRASCRQEVTTLVEALDMVEAEFHDGDFVFAPGDEDMHTAIERRVTELAGDVGAKLHTGRSRNDQVATALRSGAAGRCRRGRGDHGAAGCAGRSEPMRPPKTTYRATPTCSVPSRCCSPTTCWRTGGRWLRRGPAVTTVDRLNVSPSGRERSGVVPATRSRRVAAELGFLVRSRTPRRRVRPRLRGRVALRPGPFWRPSVPDGRGDRAVVHRGVRLLTLDDA